MIYAGGGSIPHQYVWIQPQALGEHGWIEGAWFGLCAHPGRAWGAHVVLECGAIYRNVPLHVLASRETETAWTPPDASTWDVYGVEFSVTVYDYLYSTRLEARTRSGATHLGEYICTVIPIGDSYSAAPEQAKEFLLCRLDNGRYTLQPTNYVLIHDRSFTRPAWPTWLRRQTDRVSVED